MNRKGRRPYGLGPTGATGPSDPSRRYAIKPARVVVRAEGCFAQISVQDGDSAEEIGAQVINAISGLTGTEADPIPMLLWCPECGARHVDVGVFATKRHHTHACQTCGHVWRPAIDPTCGVQFLPGFRNA